MKDLREYRIPFVGLKNGEHHFNYEVDSQFFTFFPDSQVHEGRIFADLTFDKKERLFILNFDISGTVDAICDICGQDFKLPIHGNYTQYIKTGEEPEQATNEDEDVMWIAENESILNVSNLIYEFIHLSLPMQIKHPDKANGDAGCNPEILHILKNLKTEKEETDPRWEVLKQIKKD